MLLELQTNTAPSTIRIDLLGYPGYPNAKLAVTGQHGQVVVPALPNDLSSETARGLEVRRAPDNM